jgi:hypothetical protein
MKMLRSTIAAALLFAVASATPVLAQWQTPNHSVPLGKGGGVQGFGNAAPGVAGQPFVSTGPTTDPAFGTIANSGFAPGAANTVKGSLNGTTTADLPVPPCTAVNQALQWTAGTGASCGSILTTTGYDMPINMGLSSSAVGGALTISLTTANGGAPSVSAPVLVPFRSTTATSGTVTWSTISSSLILTIPSGATLGTSSSNVPFRVWIFLDANGGTPAVGVATCSNATTIFACSSWESTLKTSVTISAGAVTGGTLYTTAGVSLDAVRIIGYCDFANGLTAAGTWASACTTLQVLGPGIKKPGDVIQTAFNTTGAVATGTTPLPSDDTIPQITEGDQYMSQAITPTATPNLLEIEIHPMLSSNTNARTLTSALFQDATASALAVASVGVPTQFNVVSPDIRYTMIANTAASTTFRLRAGTDVSGTVTFNGVNSARLMGGVYNSYVRIREIQG